MAMKKEDFEIFAAHLASKTSWAEKHTCPVCGTNQWSAGGPIGAPTYVDMSEGPGTLGPGAMLFASLTCKKCFYTILFQWLPIQAASDV